MPNFGALMTRALRALLATCTAIMKMKDNHHSSLQPTFSLFFLMCFSTWCSLATTSPLLADFFLGSPGRASMWLSSTLCSRQAPNQSCAGKD